jgi:hypothetical protein
MDPTKNVSVLTQACLNTGVPFDDDASAKDKMARLMNLPKVQKTGPERPNVPATKVAEVLTKATYMAGEISRIEQCYKACGRGADTNVIQAEAERRWNRKMKVTIQEGDMKIQNNELSTMADEIRHNGWKLVLVDDQHHYFRFTKAVVAQSKELVAKPPPTSELPESQKASPTVSPTAANRQSLIDAPTDDEDETLPLKRYVVGSLSPGDVVCKIEDIGKGLNRFMRLHFKKLAEDLPAQTPNAIRDRVVSLFLAASADEEVLADVDASDGSLSSADAAAPAAPASASAASSSTSDMTIQQLKEECNRRGVADHGDKNTLLQRLSTTATTHAVSVAD